MDEVVKCHSCSGLMKNYGKIVITVMGEAHNAYLYICDNSNEHLFFGMDSISQGESDILAQVRDLLRKGE